VTLARSDLEIAENVSDTRPYFERTGVLLYAPDRGSGMKVKVLEAFAYGVPVVTTSDGVEGIPAQDGVHVGLCDEDAGLIERTVRLLGDRASQERQRRAARQLVERCCNPGTALDAVESCYAELLARRLDSAA
jgi:glycosyltransferase involved in cell wall biosynthesis